jgi:SNF2 family DNA or RNA helicase
MLMLRRLKYAHLPGLPKVTVHRFEEPMPSAQAQAYAAAVARAKSDGGDQTAMLRALHEMRVISLHPNVDSIAAEALVKESARIRRMVQVLDEVHSAGEKALIFLEFKAVQAVLIEFLQKRYQMSSAPFVINGDVPGDRRKRRVDEFQSRDGFDVMILSPRAGGVGLTLTAANHVIHLARWWNPAVEDQCTDRVNRIGQTRDVHVYLPLARHPVFGEQSFDLLLDALLARKRVHSEDTLAPAEVSTKEMSELFESVTT